MQTIDVNDLDFVPVDQPIVEPIIAEEPISQDDYSTSISDIYKQFSNREDDTILFEGRETKIFDLPKEDQLEVFLQLIKNRPAPVVNNTQIADEDLAILNEIKANNISLKDYLIALQSQEQQPQFYDVTSMSLDQVMEYDIRKTLAESGTEVAEEDILDQLQTLKSSKNFNKIAEATKAKLLREEQEQVAYQEQVQANEQQQRYQTMSNAIIDYAVKTNEILGFELEKDDKNETIQTLIELDNEGLTWFDKQVINNPSNLVKASWLLKNESKISDYISNLENQINNTQTNFQAQLDAAYKKGQQDVVKSKFPVANNTEIKTAIVNKQFSSNGLNATSDFDPSKMKSVDDLY